MKQKTKQLIMTLVALLALTTHAWATDPKVYDSGDVELSSLQVGDILMPGVTLTKGSNSVAAYLDYDRFSKNEVIQTSRWKITSNPFSIGLNGLINAQLAGSGPYDCMPITEDGKAGNAWVVTSISGSDIRIGGTTYPKPTPFAITWSAATPNTASIDKMPAGNVTVSVDYFAQAELAESGAPAAIADVPANTDEPIVTAGTVANIGTSEVKQGTLMYFVSQSTGETAPEAPDYDTDGWSENVPTANGLAQGKAYVWYYIKGAEPANITDRSDDNTRSDSDIKPLGTNGIVTLGAEPTYDVTLNAEGLSTDEAAAWKVAKGTDQPTAFPLKGVKKSETVTVTYTGSKKVIGVKAEKKAKAPTPTLAEATAEDYGKVVCAAGHLHDAKTAVPAGCTAVGILGKVTETGHGLILALKNAEQQTWNTINGWASASYAGTTLKVLPDDAARGTNLASYTTLGETTVSNWAVAQKSDYEAIFTNLGSTKNSGGRTYDNNVNAYITTGVGGTAMAGTYWSATQDDDYDAWYFLASYWDNDYKTYTYYVRPVLGF